MTAKVPKLLSRECSTIKYSMRTKLVQEIDWLSSGAEHHTGRSSGGKEISGSRRQIGQHKTGRTLGNSGIQTEAVPGNT